MGKEKEEQYLFPPEPILDKKRVIQMARDYVARDGQVTLVTAKSPKSDIVTWWCCGYEYDVDETCRICHDKY